MEYKVVVVEDALLPPAKPKPNLWVELIVVFLLAVLPHIFNAVYYLARPKLAPASFTWNAFQDLVFAIQEGAVVLFIMRLSGKPWSTFGLVRPNLVDIFWTIFVFFAMVVSMIGVAMIVSPDPFKDRLPFSGSGDRAWFPILVSYFSIAFGEELVMRGYFIPRLKELLGTNWEAVLISSVLFASYHIYQGPQGTGTSFLLGLVLGSTFCFIGRLWPLILAHALWDILVHIIHLPL